MTDSRRNFLNATGSGVALTAFGGEAVFTVATAPLAVPNADDEGEGDIHL